MADSTTTIPAGLTDAFKEYERGVRIHNYRVACILALVFMPLGGFMDYFMFWDDPELVLGHDKVTAFILFRFLCSTLLFGIWWLVRTPFGLRNLWLLGQVVAAVPSFFISLMIYYSGGAQSSYYAGINLVLLGAGLVLRWTLLDSILVVVTAFSMYLAACVLSTVSLLETWTNGLFINNLYFLSVTGVFVIIGNFFYNRIRFREFALRWELDNNRKKLEESNRKLKELDEIKSRFFANISHELRTPLTLLLAPLETLLHKYSASIDESARSLLLTMHSNGMRLLKLINDLLDLVRLESGRMEVKPEAVPVAAFLDGLVTAARQMADDKRLRLESKVEKDLGTVMIDRDKLEKVVLNLIFNALKFTPAGGRVELSARSEAQNLRIQVSDTGMGIPEKHLPYIFDRFWQADGSSKRKYQGVGIGLALVKELTEMQGGTVTVESLEGKGTTFRVSLPYEPAPAPPPVKSHETKVDGEAGAGSSGTVSSEEWLVNLYRRAELFPALSPVQDAVQPVKIPTNGSVPTLLVADDEPEMLRFLRSQLSQHYEVLEAVDGQQAVDKAAQFLPDIILLDMMMPEKDGLQACKEIRSRVSTQSIPVLLLTARADEETKLSALSAGASDFLAKPFSTTELHVRVKNLVESYAYQRKLSRQNQVLESTIEQLKDTETQLVQTEKLASLGRMSAGIIHEINNPLNFATTGLFALRKKGTQMSTADSAEFQEILNDVEDGIKRVKNIVCDLQTFSHPETQSRDQVEAAEVIQSALRFLSSEWKGKVRVQVEIPPGQTILANRNKLLQVAINLLQNSFDALKAKTFTEGHPEIRVRGEVTAGKSLIIIRDNGTGIEAKDRDKIFDPFFTTKPIGKGMGLGLAICYRIVQELDGRISLQTEPGAYCEFTLEFPRQAR